MEEHVMRTLRANHTLVIVDRASLAHTVKLVSRNFFSHHSYCLFSTLAHNK